eukprot:NODE_2713_length_2160_cov_3.896704.p1 GENE.NODE_2713_length_2160_cov_3.896704~~NODE_2713_length_2160_cov_3.896704.p1  ORF type:complete len:679 (+),score=158.84 NODE_2713_length_2160_cov_3.896704:120-2156(+)
MLPLSLLTALYGVLRASHATAAPTVRKPPSAFCEGEHGACPWVRLGDGVGSLHLDIAAVCEQGSAGGSMHMCNYSLTPACQDICEGDAHLGAGVLQRYVDDVMGSNPFYDLAGEAQSPWIVPQTDLAQESAFVFMTHRQALYIALRVLALRRVFPSRPLVSNASGVPLPASSTSALEYGLTYGCNWQPSDSSFAEEPACTTHGVYSGVCTAGIQGNVFGLLAWARQLALENHGAPSHDNVIGAVRGGRSGPEAKRLLDTPEFWARHSRPATKPAVCHFEAGEWVWRGDHQAGAHCHGSDVAPAVYGEGIEDFMSVDASGTIAIDIGGAQYGGGRGSASGETYSTQDESTPTFYPEGAALAFHSRNRSVSTGTTALVFLGVRRYFSGQSGSHGYDADGLQLPLFKNGSPCGSLGEARLLPPERVLTKAVSTTLGATPVRMFQHALGVITSSCGTCAAGTAITTATKFRTAGATCLVQWRDGKSLCAEAGAGNEDWTFWKDVWIWVGALHTAFYPNATQSALASVVQRVATGPWGAGVWFGNTLQYFFVAWLGTELLSEDAAVASGDGLRLDYYAYGAPGQGANPIGGFCEQYQAQGYEDVVVHLPEIEAAFAARRSTPTLAGMYKVLQSCSRCDRNCTFPGVGINPRIYCTTPCTDDFLSCVLAAADASEHEGLAVIVE